MSAFPASILAAATPAAWVDAAVAALPQLINDHADCEKKAASTAIALMFAYAEDVTLAVALSRLAREELRHFEQVRRLMSDAAIGVMRQAPGRYAAGLRRVLAREEPDRKLDLLLSGALIEARSCERFELLAPRIGGSIGAAYAQLARSEARHFELYLEHARRVAPERWAARLELLARCEAELVTRPDEVLRFHSGPPIAPGAARSA